MSNWNFDIAAAPRGEKITKLHTTKTGTSEIEVFQPARVILATKCGKVTPSQYLPKEDRWEALASGESPIAWQAWPDHPNPTRPLEQESDR